MAEIRLVSDGDPQHARAIKALNWLPSSTAIEVLESARADYDVLIECKSVDQEIDTVSPGLRIAYVVRDASVLCQLQTLPLRFDVLFIPNRLTVLDAYSFGRFTLKASRDLAAGHAITTDDLALERNGAGIGVESQERLVGRHLAYAINRDMPIDFGLLQ